MSAIKSSFKRYWEFIKVPFLAAVFLSPLSWFLCFLFLFLTNKQHHGLLEMAWDAVLIIGTLTIFVPVFLSLLMLAMSIVIFLSHCFIHEDGFWSWLLAKPLNEEKFGRAKRIFLGFIVFLAIPICIYGTVSWNPIIWSEQDSFPITAGLPLIVVIYWAGICIAYKKYVARSQLNRLMDELLSADDENLEHLFCRLKDRRKLINSELELPMELEEKFKWFCMK